MATIIIRTRRKEPDINQGIIRSGAYTHKCFCCSSQSQFLILLKTCNHSDFLDSFVKNKRCLDNAYICIFCHRMLIKIELFKRQVEDNILLLEDRVPFIKTNKLNNLNRTQPVTTDSTKPLDFEFEIKTEIEIQHEPDILETENGIQNETDILETEIGILHEPSKVQPESVIKHDHNYLEIEIPSNVTNNEKKESDNKIIYEGMFRVFNVTPEELKAEREEMAKKERYLSLPYKCETCIVSFDHNVTWENHMKKRHTKTDKCFQCDVCLAVFTTESGLREHLKLHYRRYECLKCGMKYNNNTTAMAHYNEKHIPVDSKLRKQYECSECEYRSTIFKDYKYHLRKHAEKKVTCNICDKTFINNNSYRTHMYTVHKQSSRVYRCEPCNKTFSAKTGLNVHMRTHEDNLAQSYCAPCGTYYRTKQLLLTHLSTSSKHVSDSDKRFICDQCGVRYVKKSDIRNHILWDHLKIKPHKCDKCTKAFRRANELIRHIAYVHNKEQPPKDKICQYCGKGFSTKVQLESHIRTHTGERPFVCRHCNATFGHSASHYTHIKLKHGGVK